MAIRKKWSIVVCIASLTTIFVFIMLQGLMPLRQAKNVALGQPDELHNEVQQLINWSIESNNSLWPGGSNELPAIIRSLDPLNVWVMPEIGVVDVQLTAGFYHTGLLLTTSSQSLEGVGIVPYPIDKLAPNIYVYKGIIAEN